MILDEIRYQAKKQATWLTGKGVTTLIATAAAGGGPWGAILGSGVNMWTVQMDYEHDNRMLLKNFSSFIGAQVDPPTSNPTMDNLRQVAKFTPAFQEALDKNNLKRMFGFAKTAALAAIGVGVLIGLSGVGIPVIAGAAAIGAAIGSSWLIQAVGKKVLGLDKPTVCDKILKLEKGQYNNVQISKQQVISLAKQINPNLSDRTEYHIEDMLQKVNSKQINARELAFAINGQRSNIPEMAPHVSAFQRVNSVVSSRAQAAAAAVGTRFEAARNAGMSRLSRAHTGEMALKTANGSFADRMPGRSTRQL